MQEDSVYPNDGTYFGGVPLEPQEQAIERKKERAQTLEKDDILKDLLERWQQQLTFYCSTKNISDEVKLDLPKLGQVMIAYGEITQVLEAEISYLKSLIR